jgi:hypothetical protein
MIRQLNFLVALLRRATKKFLAAKRCNALYPAIQIQHRQ